ncbi:DUF5107 domain-containing protein [Actinotalea sp. K2]|uniref:DUF5107 domain-containing protein n=1 Tax=Actinotalea sp. K2 TaxID=2939438 RepID=UPI002017477E|nr:DUF5107 domain-containing protein [Actinotalea sp. K2]MCL3860818.1 DUF5107 domain-containing protein [Actinotalea sp. K2]
MLDEESRLDLPPVPSSLTGAPVAAWREPLTIDTYLPAAPDRYPAFLENRVYQGSSGRIYPLPFHERISATKAPRQWDAVHLENAWVRLVVLPELGGRLHIGLDKTTGYDFFYRNNVIKPALVGLGGPWVSGGVELNWPQHHRPGTFLPTEALIEHEDDGAVTVWCSDHDPFARMKGMHGFRLRPDSSVIELRARLFNRTDDVQTFLWWANVAVAVNDDYQSFFPTDVHAVADHAKRAVTAFPRADRPYYGVDYQERAQARPDADRIDWYRNIPVPTSYMCLGSQDDFFGGYDHGVDAGFVHWADHRVSPGKKQWTWGNGPFGWAWDANLTDTDGPYVELMAGVYTDNQPDFSFLAPGETKTFSQYWYPLQQTGPVHQATLDVAVRLDVVPGEGGGTGVRVAAATTAVRPGLELSLVDTAGTLRWSTTADAAPGQPVVCEVGFDDVLEPTDLTLVVGHEGTELLRWTHRPPVESPEVPPPASEPPAPGDVSSVDELYLVGLHLEQYRHATRSPEPYWRQALDRDPGDVRCNVALAVRRLPAGRYAEAEQHLRTAVGRQTRLNPNPADGEATYRLGQVLARTGRTDEAYDAYAKAAWNAAWSPAAHLAMARIDARRGADPAALDHAQAVLAADAQNLQARCVAVTVLRRLGRTDEATRLLDGSLRIDPLDTWSRDLAGQPLGADAPTLLDVALERASVGEQVAALRLLDTVAAMPTVPGQVGVAPLALYHRSDLLLAVGEPAAAQQAQEAARCADATYCLPSRLDDIDMLGRILEAWPQDARAWALLGHWLYFQRRYADAVQAWERSVDADPDDPVVWRNLAVAAFNVHGDADLARHHYDQARSLAPQDARLLYELDQLDKRTGRSVEHRLARLEAAPEMVGRRDDLTVELIRLLVAAGRAREALALLHGRRFQPWEGGEGQVLSAWDETLLTLAREELAAGRATTAVGLLGTALEPAQTLGEGRHPLANCSHLLLALGDARCAVGDHEGARDAWRSAATFAGDFQGMAPTAYSDMTYYSVLASRRLEDHAGATTLLDGLAAHVDRLAATPATVDYFATSLPSMLLFTDDVQELQDTTVLLLRAQVAALHGELAQADALAAEVAVREPGHVRALDLQRALVGEHVS